MATKVTALSGLKSSLNVKLPDKFKGTIIERWGHYWKQLITDYQEVFVGVGETIKTKPLKSIVYIYLGGVGYYCCKNNPNEVAFKEQLINYNNQMVLVNENLHNPVTTEYLQTLERCVNQKIIKRFSIGIMSFLWLDNYNKDCALYKAICPYLKPSYLNFHNRIIDVGFLNTWWNLTLKMQDYDVKE